MIIRAQDPAHLFSFSFPYSFITDIGSVEAKNFKYLELFWDCKKLM